MDDPRAPVATEIQTVRRFNRTVTRSIGIFDSNYLGRRRALAASRLLFEIGPTGREVRELRERLGLDSGYLSRLLRALERDRLIEVVAATGDRRVRRARLTPAGSAEVETLERLSDEAASTLLEGLRPAQRERMLGAMATVERLLAAQAVTIAPVPVADARVQSSLASYYAELAERFEQGFDPGDSAQGEELAPPGGFFLIASLFGQTVGCGGVRYWPDFAEIKRMWVAPEHRGLGIASRLLERLEQEARERGLERVRLDTNRVLSEAQALYRRAGYRRIEPYNDNPYASYWYEKAVRTG